LGDFGVCCNEVPEDGPGGSCGCPSGFVFDPIDLECKYQPLRCGYDEINRVNKCTSLSYIINHPIECLLPQRENTPFEQACCLDTSYQGENYYNWKNVEVN